MTAFVKTTYESHLERRDGQLIVLTTKTTSTVPVTGRGREWSKAANTYKTTEMPLAEARKLALALTECFADYLADATHIKEVDD